MTVDTSAIEPVSASLAQRSGTASYARPKGIESLTKSPACVPEPPPRGVTCALTAHPPLRIGEQPSSGLPRYRDFERRRRRAQIAARHALDLSTP